MYYHDKRLQYPVKVDKPDPLFARQLQQAIGGIEGEIRVCLQYFFQAWGARGPSTKYRDVLLNTATEEIGHIEMLSTAVALNLDDAPATLQETTAQANRSSARCWAAASGRATWSRACSSATCSPPAWRPCPPIATACRSTARTSMPAATSSATCSATWRRRRPAAPWRCDSTTPPTTRACRTC